MMIDKIVRPSPIAGTWYSANPQQLKRAIDSYINEADLPKLPGEVIGVVAPHAGYRYSGAVAGHAFKSVKGKSFDLVVVVSPLHQYHPHPILTSAHSAYRTPLGDIPIAEEQLEKIDKMLQERIRVGMTPIANDQEHSLEIELPFLQCSLANDFKLIPIMLRDQTRRTTRILGKALADCLKDESVLLVASSDLSHFYPEAVANQLDNKVLSTLVEFSPEGLFDLKDAGEGHACGLSAIATVLWCTQEIGGNGVTLLNYDTSASSTGDSSSVVGYGAAAITRS